jgi:hypothetical protein
MVTRIKYRFKQKVLRSNNEIPDRYLSETGRGGCHDGATFAEAHVAVLCSLGASEHRRPAAELVDGLRPERCTACGGGRGRASPEGGWTRLRRAKGERASPDEVDAPAARVGARPGGGGVDACGEDETTEPYG